MKKTYKFLLILFFICIIKLFFTSASYAALRVEILDKEGHEIVDKKIENNATLTADESIDCTVNKEIKLNYKVHNSTLTFLDVEVSCDRSFVSKATINTQENSVTITPSKAGTGWLKLTARTYTILNLTDDPTKATETTFNTVNMIIKINVQEDPEKIQEEVDEIATFYKGKKIKNIKTAHASEQLLYLRSILYNDLQNGNFELWNKFVNNTTPEERKAMYKNITYNIRDSDSENQSAINSLKAQIDEDGKKITEEEANKIITEGQKEQTRYVNEKISLISEIKRGQNYNHF